MKTLKKKILKLDESRKYQVVETDTKVELKREVQLFSLGLVRDIGFSIAIPLVLGAFAGAWLDQRFNMRPKFTLSFLIAGLLISIISLYKIVKDIINNKR